MVAADNDGRLQLTAADHLVEREAGPRTIAQTDPAYARRQSLELDTRPRHVEPGVQMRVVRKHLLHPGVGLVDIMGIARQCDPAEWPDAAAEEGTDVGRHEAGKVEGVCNARLQS